MERKMRVQVPARNRKVDDDEVRRLRVEVAKLRDKSAPPPARTTRPKSAPSTKQGSRSKGERGKSKSKSNKPAKSHQYVKPGNIGSSLSPRQARTRLRPRARPLTSASRSRSPLKAQQAKARRGRVPASNAEAATKTPGEDRHDNAARHERNDNDAKELEELRTLAWGLKTKLDRADEERSDLRSALEDKEIALRRRERQVQKLSSSRSRGDDASLRKARHLEVLIQARELEMRMPHRDSAYTPMARAQTRKGISRTDRMALRSRTRTVEEQRLAVEYEAQRRELAAAREEEKQERKRARRRRKQASQRIARGERLRELQEDFQGVWNEALQSAHPSAVRSRPSVSNGPLLREPNRAAALAQAGCLEVRISDSFLQSFLQKSVMRRSARGDPGASTAAADGASAGADAEASASASAQGGENTRGLRLRLALLPHGEAHVLRFPLETHVAAFSYKGVPAMSGSPVLRIELHGHLGDSDTGQAALLAQADEPLDSCFFGALAGGGTSEAASSLVRKQIALSNKAGVLQVEIRFTPTPRVEQPMEGLGPALHASSRLAVSSPGVLRLRVVQAMQLKNVNMVLPQDPFVQLSLLPWAQTVSTPAMKGAGTEVRWAPGEATFDLAYPGAPPRGHVPVVRVTVMERENVRSDQFIGEGFLDVLSLMQRPLETTRATVHLRDQHNSSAGQVVIHAAFAAAKTPTAPPERLGLLGVLADEPPSPLFLPQADFHPSRFASSPVSPHPELNFTSPPYRAAHGKRQRARGEKERAQSPRARAGLFGAATAELPRHPPGHAQACMFQQSGKLFLRAIHGRGLRNVQRLTMVGKQDPYVRVSVNGVSAKCKPHKRGGRHPEWSADAGTIEMPYVGASASAANEWPLVQVEVLDWEMLFSDRPIGSATMALVDLSQDRHQHELQLWDGDALAGVLVLETWFQQTPSLELLLPVQASSRVLSPGNTGRWPWSSQCTLPGTLTCLVTSCTNLRSIHILARQDPYVKATLLPWKQTSSSKSEASGGRNPTWAGDAGRMDLEYPGAPPSGEPATLLLEVWDADSVLPNQLIGRCEVPLGEVMLGLDAARPTKNLHLNLMGGGKEAKIDVGAINLLVGFVAMESKLLRAVRPITSKRSASAISAASTSHLALRTVALCARALKCVQRIGRQDPYVRVTHVRSGNSARTRCHGSGGTSPAWTIEAHASEMRLLLDAAQPGQEEALLLEVLDEELVMENRLIGSVRLNIWRDVLKHPSHGTDVPMTFRLLDRKGAEAGVLMANLVMYGASDKEADVLREAQTTAKTTQRAVPRPTLDIAGVSSSSPFASQHAYADADAGVCVSHVYVRVMRGRDVLEKPAVAYCTVGFSGRSLYTRRAAAAQHPVWSQAGAGGPGEHQLFRLDSSVTGAAAGADISHTALRGGSVTVTVSAKHTANLLSSRVGRVLVPLRDAPYVYEEDAADFDARAQWFCLDNDSGGELQISVLLIKHRPESHAAKRIQTARRRQLGQRRHFCLRRSIAATLIQRLRRCHVARKQVSTRRLHELDCRTERALARAQLAGVRDASAAVVIQARTRGLLTRSHFAMRKVAGQVIRVQRLVRRFRARQERRFALKKLPRGLLKVQCVRAWGLREAQWIRRQDPYVKLTLQPGNQERRTKACVNGGVAPEWCAVGHQAAVAFALPGVEAATCAELDVQLAILDKPLLGTHKLIGSGRWRGARALAYANEEVRDRQCIMRLAEDGGSLELRVSWIPESHFIYVVTRIQGIFRARLQRARYQVAINAHRKAANVSESIRLHSKRAKLRAGLADEIFEHQNGEPMRADVEATGEGEGEGESARATQPSVNEKLKAIKEQKDRNKLHGDQGSGDPAVYGEDQWVAAVRIQSSVRGQRDRRFSAGLLQAKLSERARVVREQRQAHSANPATEPKSPQGMEMKDKVHVRIVEAADLPRKSSIFCRGHVLCKVQLLPKGSTACTRATTVGVPSAPQWTDDEGAMNLTMPVDRALTDWPAINVSIVRPSLLGADLVVAEARYALFDHMRNNGKADVAWIPLNDAHGTPAGRIKAVISVHLERVTDDEQELGASPSDIGQLNNDDDQLEDKSASDSDLSVPSCD